MSIIGSGERVVILGDRISTSAPIGSDIPTPTDGRIVIFLYTDGGAPPVLGLYSKDSNGDVKPLDGGTGGPSGWKLYSDGSSPTYNGDITHAGGAAVGASDPGSLPGGITFFVGGSSSQSGGHYLEQQVGLLADLASHTQLFSKLSDKGLYSKPDTLPERRIDAPGMSRKALPDNEALIIPNGSQYVAYGSFTLGAEATITLEGDADLVVI